jgi:hypothetical protein
MASTASPLARIAGAKTAAVSDAELAVHVGRAAPLGVWGMLFLRSGLAICLQIAVAAVAWLVGAVDPWRASADWWLGWFAIANVANLGLLRWLLHREGRRLRDVYRIRRRGVRRDLQWVVLALVVAGPVGFLPNLLLGQALWGSAQVGQDLGFRALPLAAAIALLVVFPIVQAAAELPTYFGYVMPRLGARYGWRLSALVVTAAMLSTQHIFLPFLLDWRFLLWRGLMFLPFAVWIGFIIYRRPATLPYLAVGHGLLDASLPVMVLLASV